MPSIADQAFDAFEQVVARSTEFKARAGQVQMAAQVARTLSGGTLGEADEPDRSIVVIQAGTGVGKSLAASVPAIVAALERKTRVIISTATVALQSQLMEKDLPYFASLMDRKFSFALAKGRGRYVCKLKLNRLAGGQNDPDADLFGDLDTDTSDASSRQSARLAESSVVLYKELANELASGTWDGERDSLKLTDVEGLWAAVAADRSTCSGKHCPLKNDCVYFAARKRLAEANVIVANHDLLLASLDANVLPKLEDTLLILDEAHGLPEVASSQFSLSIDLSSLRWLDQLGQRFSKVGAAIKYPATQDAVQSIAHLKQRVTDMQTLVMSMFGDSYRDGQSVMRLPNGILPEALIEPLSQLQTAVKTVSSHMKAIAAELRERMKEEPGNTTLATMYTALGALQPRVTEVEAGAEMLLQEKSKPDAKWVAISEHAAGYLQLTLNVSPIVPGDLLVYAFWPRVRSAVLTSATLMSCGNFNFFLSEVGLNGNPDVNRLQVDSPFDYPSQGELVVSRTASEPRNIEHFNREVAEKMIADFSAVTSGALALFTSRSHMELLDSLLPSELRKVVLRQGTNSNSALLQEHKRKVDAGLPSIILGLQSFGQGVDLPGQYCETLFIAKLPFSPPTEPIGEARAEWLESQRRNAFMEIAVPATGVKLAQWMGRLIRTEQDRGKVICYDKRLVDTQYGQLILASMPSFRRSTR